MKILYNVTVKIDTSVHQEWLEWMNQVHIPEIMDTGCFESYRLTRIMEDPDEHGVGFAVQYVAKDISDFDIYQLNFAASLQKKHADRYAGQYAAFRTLMQIESEG